MKKYDVHNLFDACYDPRLSNEEHWALLLRTIRHFYEVETGNTYVYLKEILDGKNYYILTTNQNAQLFILFPADKITRLQGDSRYFQCKRRCHDAIYYNKEFDNNTKKQDSFKNVIIKQEQAQKSSQVSIIEPQSQKQGL